MWTVVKVPDTSATVLRGVLDEWKAGIDTHDPARVAAMFTEDAIFQGLQPYSVGRDGVYAYYDGQPVGMTVDYRIEQIRTPATGVVFGYARADFTKPDGTVIELNLGVVVTDGRIVSYQVSPLAA